MANDTADEFEKETGCKVIVDAVAYTEMYDKVSTEIRSKVISIFGCFSSLPEDDSNTLWEGRWGKYKD